MDTCRKVFHWFGYVTNYDIKFNYPFSTDEKEDTKLLTGTHPPFKDRINNLSSVLTENQLINKIQPVVKERFNKNVRIQ